MSMLEKHKPFNTRTPKDRLLKGRDYLCETINFIRSVWNVIKFNMVFPATYLHWDEGPPYGTAKPFELLRQP